jgi:maltose alpha-D-glucosyltransferase/alpha-amylase
MTMALLQAYVSNQGDAWSYTLNHLNNYFETIFSSNNLGAIEMPRVPFLDLLKEDPPAKVAELIGAYLDSARLLGRRTGEMHTVLASGGEDPSFAPEPFSKLYQRSLYQSMRSLTGRVFRVLARQRTRLPANTQEMAQEVLSYQDRILDTFHSLLDYRLTAKRIRCHGDYHLGQVLFTGRDFFIIDFEGEPARPISERRIKRSALRDVAGMLRSFHYAAYSALFNQEARGFITREDYPRLEEMMKLWHTWVCASFLRSYMEHTAGGNFLPGSKDELRVLLSSYVLEKAVYELGYELNNRPDWAAIPLKGIQQSLAGG